MEQQPLFGSSEPFPFLYYGHHPGDWRDQTHVWEVKFESAPTQDDKERIARAFAPHIGGAPFGLGMFQWADRWMCFMARERWPTSEPDYVAMFDRFERLFRSIHGVCPIAEVVHANSTRKGASEWDEWSHQQQSWPSPHPVWRAGNTTLHRNYGLAEGYEDQSEARLGEGLSDAYFDALLNAEYEALRHKEARKSTAGIELVPTNDVPIEREIPESVVALGKTYQARRYSPSLDGKRALGVYAGQVFEFDAAADRVRAVFRIKRAKRAVYASDDQVAVLGDALVKGDPGLILLGPNRLPVATLPIDGGAELHAFAQGRMLAVEDKAGRVRIVGVRNRELHEIALFPEVDCEVRSDGERIVFGSQPSDAREPVGLAEAYGTIAPTEHFEQWAAQQRDQLARGEGGFEPIDDAPDAVPDRVAKLFRDATELYPWRADLWIGVVEHETGAALEVVDQGQKREVALPMPIPLMAVGRGEPPFSIAPDGSSILVGAGGQLFDVDLDAKVTPVKGLREGLVQPEIYSVRHLGENGILLVTDRGLEAWHRQVPQRLMQFGLSQPWIPASVAATPDRKYFFFADQTSRENPIFWLRVFVATAQGFEEGPSFKLCGPGAQLTCRNGTLVAKTGFGTFALRNYPPVAGS